MANFPKSLDEIKVGDHVLVRSESTLGYFVPWEVTKVTATMFDAKLGKNEQRFKKIDGRKHGGRESFKWSTRIETSDAYLPGGEFYYGEPVKDDTSKYEQERTVRNRKADIRRALDKTETRLASLSDDQILKLAFMLDSVLNYIGGDPKGDRK